MLCYVYACLQIILKIGTPSEQYQTLLSSARRALLRHIIISEGQIRARVLNISN